MDPMMFYISRVVLLPFLFMCLVVLPGCAIVKAAKGKKDANLSVLKEGTPRAIVVAGLGAPLYSDKSTDIYEACKGDESSLGRAIGHGVLDLLTFGLWEVIGTPIEMASDADKECFRLHVIYDENNNLKEVK